MPQVRGGVFVEIHFAKADPMPRAEETTPLVLVFDGKLPEIAADERAWEEMRRKYYQEGAEALVDALQQHVPGGLFDAVFAEMARRRASLLAVAYKPLPPRPEPLARRLLGKLFRVQAPPLPREAQ